MFIIAFLTFDQVGDLKNQNIVAEIAGYIFLTFGLWNIGQKSIVPHAYEYMQLGLPKNERNFQGSDVENSEGSENMLQPRGSFFSI